MGEDDEPGVGVGRYGLSLRRELLRGSIAFESDFNFEALILEVYHDLRERCDELENMTPHLFPIVVAASIDSMMIRLLDALFVEGKASRSLNGADGLTFAQRVRLCLATGLLPVELGDAMQSVGRIRNHFAHQPTASLLDDEPRAELRKLTEGLFGMYLRTFYFDQQEKAKQALAAKKAEFETKTEDASHGALRYCWLLIAVSFEDVIGKVKRLTPID